MEYSRRDFLKIGLGAAAALALENCAYGLKNVTNNYVSLDAKNRYGTFHDVLKKYFTDEAYQKMKDIPIYSAKGVPVATIQTNNKWAAISSSGGLRGILQGMGKDKKIIVKESYLTNSKFSPADFISSTIHEYIHQGQDLHLIDTDKFINAYERWEQEGRAIRIALWNGNDVYTEITSPVERMAYLGQRIATNHITDAPLYIHEVYKRLLRCSEKIISDEAKAKIYKTKHNKAKNAIKKARDR